LPKLISSQERPAQSYGGWHARPIDRRDFLRGTAALGTALPFASFGRAAAAETGFVARKVFFDNPDIGSVRVSPDGPDSRPSGADRRRAQSVVAPLAELNAARAGLAL
jgi:hypothetical protein